MRLPARFAVIGTVLLAVLVPASAEAAPCRTSAVGIRAAISAADALRWARGEVLIGDEDSLLTQMMSTGTVDAEGRSSGWTVQLTSFVAKRLHVVMFNEGAMTCTSHALEGPLMAAPVNDGAETILDLARLIRIARDALKPPPDLAVLKVNATLHRLADSDVARWSIAFVDERGYPKGDVTIDSKTGAVIK